ncbi:hypothetical protein [Novosphingobium olei]|nr:hypothetical protein NSDW_33330 [Novosphingobium olei]
MATRASLDPDIVELIKALARANVARDIELARQQANSQAPGSIRARS